MNPVSITLDDAKVQATFAKLKQLGQGSDKTNRAISLAMKQEVYNAFRFQRSPMGAAWPPLSPLTTDARKRKGNSSKQPLIATGAMFKSIEPAHTATEASITVGEGLPDARAWYTQFGMRNPTKNRPFFPDAQSTPQAWLDAVFAPVHEALKNAIE